MTDRPPSKSKATSGESKATSGLNRRAFMTTAAGTAVAVPLTARAAGPLRVHRRRETRRCRSTSHCA